ncbi:AAA family ATPase [Chamaesiphon sp. OTE_8_metabat_110]|uniref:AAA family ATPase n=2 Tax=unclassified Chamaesiphon TaxID=2620921 RepID=UPI00286D4015|nr:AAA family ATPase [Chamaesiphon sp. OTE_8_metabat_110]
MPAHTTVRELAVKSLLDTFDRVAAGASDLVLVAGCSGIGKTALINEVHKPITRQHGYFIKGKFDQFNRNLPLWGFVQALRDLIAQLTSEGEDRVAAWKGQILAAVGHNGQVLIAAIPELEQIIGAQPPAVELAPAEAQQRFNGLFQKLIAVFTTREHPLTIFLDDLQWADAASLESIELLMAGRGYLLILGAYRDNEVASRHLLMLTIERLQQADRAIGTISLAPLTFDDTARLVADTLRCPRSRTQPLTELIFLKTEGNPFFTTQFLKALYDAGEIWFNAQGNWECDIASIQTLALSDDIVEFMAAQLQKLPPPTQQLLKLAACIGNSFDLQTLEIVAEQSRSSVETLLWQALEAGLILPSGKIYKFDQDLQDLEDLQDYVAGGSHAPDDSPSLPVAHSPIRPVSPTPPLPHSQPSTLYRFLHDRVQQAAYSLISEQQQQTHLQIGRLLLANTRSQPPLANLFEIVSHWNKAKALVQEPAERALLAQLNLQAARQARAANAYGAAFRYARIGTEILGESGWTQQYPLTLALYETLADAAFLSGDFESVPGLVQIVLERARTPLDRAKSYETMIRYHGIKKQYQQAIASGLAILQQLGTKISPKPDRLTLLRELVKTKIALMGKSNERLLALPEIVDPKKIARLNILNLLQFSAFFCSQELMAVVSFVGIRLTLRDGNTPWVASFYATYCIVISSLGELKQAYRIAQLAIMLADRYANLAVTGRVKVIAPWYALPWQEPLRGTIPMLDESVRLAIEGADLQYIGINAGVAIATRFYAGIPLDEVVDRLEAAAALIVRSKDENSQQFFDLMRQTIVNLHTPSDRPTDIFKGQDEISLVSQWQSKNEAILLSTMYGFQTLLAYHFEDIPNALISADAQLPYEYSAKGGYSIARIWLFDALTRLAAYSHSDKRVQQKLLKRIDAAHRELGKRARSMPGNFQHQYDLVAAEKCRVLGNFSRAIELYDRAIAGAKANEYPQEEALANELAAKFYLAWGKAKIAAVYMQAAYYGYVLWGAKAKTADLERRYPQLLAPILAARQVEVDALATLTQITNYAAVPPERTDATGFDLAIVIQAAQTLASTIELTELIRQLSEILLQNSGAQTCILVLPDDDPDRWLIRSQSVIAKGTQATTTQLSQPLADGFDYPANLIYAIKNTQQAALLDARQPLAIPDLYLLEHQPASVFCLPIVKQERVLGVVYLEHRHQPAIFTQQHQTVITFLCHQAAIALDNARLYKSLVQRSAAIEASLDGFAILDRDRFIYLNQSHADLFSYTVAELLGRHWRCLYTPDQLQQIESVAFPAIGKCGRWRGEAIALRKDGSTFNQEVTLFSLDNGKLICICRDITDRQTMEIALRQSERRYQKLADNIPGIIYQFRIAPDGSMSYPYVSSGCWELLQLTPAEVMADANCALDTIHPEDRIQLRGVMAQSARQMTPIAWEGRMLPRAGGIKWIKYAARPELQPDGAIVWDGVMLDITEQQAALHERKIAEAKLSQTNHRLESTNQELQRATRLKDEFLATMSHELRTPLNAILGMSEALQDDEVFGTLNLQQLEAIATIEQSGEHLLSLINDILDVAKISAGKLELHLDRVCLTELCKSSLLLVKPQAIAKQIQIETQLAVSLDWIAVDERRMRQVLINLLNNAVKFTPPGGRVKLSVSIAAADGAWLCFSVSDTGIGIRDADLAKLFQPFVQIDSSLNRKYSGSGLGLVLVKQIVELHGGTVTIASEVNKGSCFSVMLPPDCWQLESTPSQTIADRDPPAQPRVAPTILLAESSEVIIDTFANYLTAKGDRVIVARTAPAAIDLARSHAPDLILVDLQLASADGRATFEALCRFPSPVIAMTAGFSTEDRARCLQLGAAAYLTKPIKLLELHQLIQDCLYSDLASTDY